MIVDRIFDLFDYEIRQNRYASIRIGRGFDSAGRSHRPRRRVRGTAVLILPVVPDVQTIGPHRTASRLDAIADLPQQAGDTFRLVALYHQVFVF